MTDTHIIQVPIPYQVKWVNCYYIADSTPTLIDTGVNTDEGLETIKAEIEAQGGKLREIRRIIITHGHIDHVGLAGRIAEISGAEVFVHPWDSVKWAAEEGKQFASKREDYRQFFAEAGVPEGDIDDLVELIVSRYRRLCSPLFSETMMKDGTVFEFDDFNLRAIHTPGHSPGSVCLFNQSDGALFTGDTLFPEIFSNPTMEITGSLEHKSLISHQGSLEHIKRLGAKIVMPGHGRPFERLEVRIRRIQKRHRQRSEEMMRVLAWSESHPTEHAGMTQFMVATQVFGSLSGMDIFYGVSSAKGHLDALEQQGLATRMKKGAQYVYRANQLS